MYCMHCQKEYEHEMFCPECGRMLVGNNTFNYQKNNNREKTYYEEQRARVQQVQQRKIDEIKQQQKLDEQNIPKCPICGSTNLKKLSALNRGASAFMWGLGSNKIGKTYECVNCKATF